MENTRTFRCTCGNDLEMKSSEFIKHLKEVHKLENMQGSKRMEMHLDGRDYFSTTYLWTMENGLQFREYTICLRPKKLKR